MVGKVYGVVLQTNIGNQLGGTQQLSGMAQFGVPTPDSTRELTFGSVTTLKRSRFPPIAALDWRLVCQSRLKPTLQATNEKMVSKT